MQIIDIVLLVIGLAILTVGAEVLVKGASRLASSLGVPSLVVGLTIVAFGTSAPELVVSVFSALNGQADVSVGNVVGSNIFNVLFILGVSAIIIPLSVSLQLIKLDVPIMIAVSILLYVVAADHNISRFEGAGLFLAILAYTGFLIFQANKDRNVSKDFEDTDQDAPKQFYIGVNLALIVCGLVLLVLGSRWFVEGAVAIARYFEVSELVIGLTIVAIGTSLPEVATSIVAAIRGQRDIAVGNVVGSNIFNILSVLGLTALVVPGGVTVSAEALSFDIPVMIAVAIVCLPIFFSGSSISRFEGILFLSYYLFYIGYIVLNALKHQALPEFSYLIAYVAFPLTALALGISTFRSFRAKRLHVD